METPRVGLAEGHNFVAGGKGKETDIGKGLAGVERRGPDEKLVLRKLVRKPDIGDPEQAAPRLRVRSCAFIHYLDEFHRPALFLLPEGERQGKLVVQVSLVLLLLLLFTGVAIAQSYQGADFRYPLIGRWLS